MEIKKSKATSLYILFLRYLALFCMVILLLATVGIVSFYYALEKGIILPANYAEQAIQKIENQLIQNEIFDESLIPFPCTYVIFSKAGDVQKGNMSKEEIDNARENLNGKLNTVNGHYRIIQRNDGSNIIIKYDLWAHFSSPVLHKLFQKPELLAIIILFVNFILIAVVIAFKFSKKLNTELTPLIKATTSIKQKDLDFNILPSQIKEFNAVLQSINELKTALSDSLKQQWNIEQSKKIQISAIAHDIKTPLTIIKGNTELLLESELAVEDKDLLQYIQTNSSKIENYIELLITASAVTDSVDFRKNLFSLQGFLWEIEEQAKALCHIKNISLRVEKSNLPETFCGDSLLISRAVLNLLDNAVEYSPIGSDIGFKITGNEEVISFTVTDSGKGFSSEGLKNSTTLFFTEQIERSGKHYGLGLHIAKLVAEKHGGQVEVSNKLEGCGAIVEFSIKNQY